VNHVHADPNHVDPNQVKSVKLKVSAAAVNKLKFINTTVNDDRLGPMNASPGKGGSRSGRLASFFGDINVRAARQDCSSPHSESLSRLMNCASKFGKDRTQLVRIPGFNDLRAELTDTIFEAARTLGHVTSNLLGDERLLLLVAHWLIRFDTAGTLRSYLQSLQ
jgi:hypothetical protein